MLHYLMFPYFNVRLFDNELAAVAIVLFTLIITAEFNIAVFQYDTICCWTILMLHYLMFNILMMH